MSRRIKRTLKEEEEWVAGICRLVDNLEREVGEGIGR